jgi:hypothetical protein
MKKGILILLGMFMMVSTVEANQGKKTPNKIGFNYSYENSVNFEERGIEFFIFTNGEFDFNTNFNNSNYDYNGNRTGINISRDYKGRIARIGNSSINYDSYGNVTRIGNVFMRYYRGQLTDVGHLKVRYDHWGNPTFYGNVKNNYYNYNGVKINLNIGDIFSYNDSYFSRNDFRANYKRIREDKNFYYYRANPNANIGKRSKTLRRRKPASTTLKNTPNTRRSNTTYRKPSNVNTKRNVTTVKKSTNISSKRPSIVNTKRSTNTTYRRPSTVTNKSVNPVKRNNASTSRKSNTAKRNTEKTTKQKVTTKDRTVRSRRS